MRILFLLCKEMASLLKEKNQMIEKLEVALEKQQDGDYGPITLFINMQNSYFYSCFILDH